MAFGEDDHERTAGRQQGQGVALVKSDGTWVRFLAAVLDGGVAVRCNPKPALAGLKSRSRLCVHRPTAGSAALKAWSCAATTFEPCQVRKEAAVRSARRVPQGRRARASGPAAAATRRSKTGARPFFGARLAGAAPDTGGPPAEAPV